VYLARGLTFVGWARALCDPAGAEEARQTAEEGLAVAQRTGDRISIGWAYRTLGVMARAQGDYARARAAFTADLAQMRALGNRLGIAAALTLLGDVAQRGGDYDGAQQYYQEVLALDRDLGAFPNRMAVVLRRLGELALERGAAVEAQAHLQESLTVAHRLHDVHQVAQTLEALARLAATTPGQQPERAMRLAGVAASLRKKMSQPLSPVEQATMMSQFALIWPAVGGEAQEAAWAAGQAMTLEQAIAYALDDGAPDA
jgi:tetratricopeptide (TPR) repeat protein